MLPLKIIAVGAAAGIILPQEALARMKVKEGDALLLTETPDGGYQLTSYEAQLDRQMSLAEGIMREDQDVLRQLAKR